jgi:hypothetical protein
MNARNVPSHPEFLDWLSEDFEKSGYDVKRLVRALVLSRVYALSHGASAPDDFAAAVERPLTAEQLARSWRVAAGLPKEDDTLRRATVSAVPEVLPKEYNATFQQALFLENSPALTGILNSTADNTTSRLARIERISERVREAFIAVFGRFPDAEEAVAAGDFLEERASDPAAGVRDLLWALMTSAEFQTMP